MTDYRKAIIYLVGKIKDQELLRKVYLLLYRLYEKED